MCFCVRLAAGLLPDLTEHRCSNGCILQSLTIFLCFYNNCATILTLPSMLIFLFTTIFFLSYLFNGCVGVIFLPTCVGQFVNLSVCLSGWKYDRMPQLPISLICPRSCSLSLSFFACVSQLCFNLKLPL